MCYYLNVQFRGQMLMYCLFVCLPILEFRQYLPVKISVDISMQELSEVLKTHLSA